MNQRRCPIRQVNIYIDYIEKRVNIEKIILKYKISKRQIYYIIKFVPFYIVSDNKYKLIYLDLKKN